MVGVPQFVCHRAKVPYNPNTGKKASPTDCETWGTFTEARRALARGNYDGIGFVFAEDAGIAGVDLDKCRDAETGQLADWAARIVDRFAPCYAEVSPSGTGLHIIVLGMLQAFGRRRKGHVEMYDGGRYFTLTGDTLTGSVFTLEPRQDALDELYAELWPPKPAVRPQTPSAPLCMDDEALLMRARNHPDAAKTARFIALFDRGDTSGYKSQSEADAALCNDLAYYCGPNAEARVADFFRRSALYRAKADRDDYVGQTIALAYVGRTAFYQPRIASGNHLGKALELPREDPRENQDEKSPASAELVAALARIRQLEEENAGLRASCERMNGKQQELRAIIEAPGDQVAPPEKLLAIELLFENVWRAHPRDEEGFAEACITTAATRIGMSKSTGIKAFGVLKDMGVFQTKELPPVMTDMGPKSRVAIAPGPVMLRPKEWIRPDGPRTHGGARANAGRKPKCVECGSEDVTERIMVQIVKRKVVETRCKACGTIHAERIGLDVMVETRHENQDEIQDDSAPASVGDVSAQDAPHTASVDASIGRHLENHPAEVNLIPPPQRPCIRCNACDWRWLEDRWRCGSCMPVGDQAQAYEMEAV